MSVEGRLGVEHGEEAPDPDMQRIVVSRAGDQLNFAIKRGDPAETVEITPCMMILRGSIRGSWSIVCRPGLTS